MSKFCISDGKIQRQGNTLINTATTNHSIDIILSLGFYNSSNKHCMIPIFTNDGVEIMKGIIRYYEIEVSEQCLVSIGLLDIEMNNNVNFISSNVCINFTTCSLTLTNIDAYRISKRNSRIQFINWLCC